MNRGFSWDMSSKKEGVKGFCLSLFVAATVAFTEQAHAISNVDGRLDEVPVILAEQAKPVAEVGTGKENKGRHQKLAWRPPKTKKNIPAPVNDKQAERLNEKWGVKLISLNLSAAGYMMDLRFRVLDVEKALPLFDHRQKPFVVAERSQARLPVPMAAKVGAFRPTNRGKNIKAHRNYYIIFANPDRHVKAGEKVTLVIGDFKVEHVTVN